MLPSIAVNEVDNVFLATPIVTLKEWIKVTPTDGGTPTASSAAGCGYHPALRGDRQPPDPNSPAATLKRLKLAVLSAEATICSRLADVSDQTQKIRSAVLKALDFDVAQGEFMGQQTNQALNVPAMSEEYEPLLGQLQNCPLDGSQDARIVRSLLLHEQRLMFSAKEVARNPVASIDSLLEAVLLRVFESTGQRLADAITESLNERIAVVSAFIEEGGDSLRTQDIDEAYVSSVVYKAAALSAVEITSKFISLLSQAEACQSRWEALLEGHAIERRVCLCNTAAIPASERGLPRRRCDQRPMYYTGAIIRTNNLADRDYIWQSVSVCRLGCLRAALENIEFEVFKTRLLDLHPKLCTILKTAPPVSQKRRQISLSKIDVSTRWLTALVTQWCDDNRESVSRPVPIDSALDALRVAVLRCVSLPKLVEALAPVYEVLLREEARTGRVSARLTEAEVPAWLRPEELPVSDREKTEELLAASVSTELEWYISSVVDSVEADLKATRRSASATVQLVIHHWNLLITEWLEVVASSSTEIRSIVNGLRPPLSEILQILLFWFGFGLRITTDSKLGDSLANFAIATVIGLSGGVTISDEARHLAEHLVGEAKIATEDETLAYQVANAIDDRLVTAAEALGADIESNAIQDCALQMDWREEACVTMIRTALDCFVVLATAPAQMMGEIRDVEVPEWVTVLRCAYLIAVAKTANSASPEHAGSAIAFAEALFDAITPAIGSSDASPLRARLCEARQQLSDRAAIMLPNGRPNFQAAADMLVRRLRGLLHPLIPPPSDVAEGDWSSVTAGFAVDATNEREQVTKPFMPMLPIVRLEPTKSIVASSGSAGGEGVMGSAGAPGSQIGTFSFASLLSSATSQGGGKALLSQLKKAEQSKTISSLTAVFGNVWR